MSSPASPAFKKRSPLRPAEAPGVVKQNVLQATINLLDAHGRKGATARAICREAGIGAPVIYHYFGDLEGLYRAAIEEAFREVAECYQRSAETKGALQGIRDSWAQFTAFAYNKPRMCRIVIEHTLEGAPPTGIARTLRAIARDITALGAAGRLNYPPETATQMLWAGALGAVGFIAMEQPVRPEPAIQLAVLEALLAAIFTPIC